MSADDDQGATSPVDPATAREVLRALTLALRGDPATLDTLVATSTTRTYSHVADNAPLLSVILLDDDVDDALVRDALVSLDAQSNTNFEVILVTVASENRRTKLVDEFSDLAQRTRVLGPVESSFAHHNPFATGVALATGRYVVALDATSMAFAHFVDTFADLATTGAPVLRARGVTQPLRAQRWPDGSAGYEPVAGAAPVGAKRFFARDHLDPFAAGSPRGSYALRRDVVRFLGAEQDEATLLVQCALWGAVSEAPDEVIVLRRTFDHDLPAHATRLFEHFTTYLHKVDPRLDPPVVVTAGKPHDAALATAPVAFVVGERSERWFNDLHRRTGLRRSFAGGVATNVAEDEFVALTILDRWDLRAVPARPASFRVLVIVTTFNEADVVEQLLERLRSEGAHVHVIDNWSNDETPEILGRYATHAEVTWERFPAAGDTGHFELEKLLRRVEDVAAASGADWVIHHDADEIRQSPWPGVSLVDALWAIDYWGYNCIDHTVLNFRPVDNSWPSGHDLATSFRWCEFGDTPADFLQIKGWKPQATRLSMAANAGHQVRFEGRRVFPYKFLLRHYSIRSQEHGERKILRERRPRWSEEERAKGWHVHYDHVDEHTSFLWDPAGLEDFTTLDQRFLLARLSGVGLAQNPWAGEGPVPGV